MAHCYANEQQRAALEQPKKRVFEKDFLQMATLTNDVMMLRRTLERDDLFEMLLCLFGPFTCEKTFEAVEHLEAFISKYCPFIRIQTIGTGANEKKFFHWDLAGDKPQKNGLDRMVQKGEESD